MKILSNIKKICLLSVFLLLTISGISAQELHPAEKDKTAKAYANRFETAIEFTNETSAKIKIFWLNGDGNRVFHIEIPRNQTQKIRSYLATPWLVTDDRDNSLGIYYPDAQPRMIQIRDVNSGNIKSNKTYDDDDDDDRRADDLKPITICSDQPIPRGYLIISAGNASGCPNWSATGKNNYTIKRPSRTAPTNICVNQNIPRGFVITGASNNWGCPDWTATGKNVYTIKRPGETEEICSISEVPPRYVLVSVGSNWNCPNWTATGTNTKRIKRLN